MESHRLVNRKLFHCSLKNAGGRYSYIITGKIILLHFSSSDNIVSFNKENGKPLALIKENGITLKPELMKT